MTAPDVSVVLPVYNTMPYLTRCLDSLVEQSLGLDRIQVIAVDDGSTDSSPEVLDSYAERHPGSFQVVHQANSGGPAEPCNRGLELAGGRYVFFLGADDYLGPEALERLVRAATHWDSDVIFGRMVGVGGRYVDQRMFGASRREVDFLNSPLAFAVSNTKLFRRSLIEQHRIRYALDLRVSSDQPFTVAALLKSRRISVLSGYPFYYAVRRARRLQHHLLQPLDHAADRYHRDHGAPRRTGRAGIGPGCAVPAALPVGDGQAAAQRAAEARRARATSVDPGGVRRRGSVPDSGRQPAAGPEVPPPDQPGSGRPPRHTARRSRLPTHEGAAVVGAVGRWGLRVGSGIRRSRRDRRLVRSADRRPGRTSGRSARSRCSSDESRARGHRTGRPPCRQRDAPAGGRLPSSGGWAGARRPSFRARHGARTGLAVPGRPAAGIGPRLERLWSAASIFARCCPLPRRRRGGWCGSGSMPGAARTTSRSGWWAITRRRSWAAAIGIPSSCARSKLVILFSRWRSRELAREHLCRRTRQDRAAAGRAVRRQGPLRDRCRHQSGRRATWSTPGPSRSRAKPTWPRSCGTPWPVAGCRPPPTPPAPFGRAETVVVVVPLFVGRGRPAGLRWHGRRHPVDRARVSSRARLVCYETTLPVGHHPEPLGADARGRLGPGGGP